jgi:hypothetical protein
MPVGTTKPTTQHDIPINPDLLLSPMQNEECDDISDPPPPTRKLFDTTQPKESQGQGAKASKMPTLRRTQAVSRNENRNLSRLMTVQKRRDKVGRLEPETMRWTTLPSFSISPKKSFPLASVAETQSTSSTTNGHANRNGQSVQ